MINKISKLKKVGIYNFEDVDYDEFLKYNMFYGWNGSGKSTLSRLYSYIGGKEISDDFADLETDVIVDGKQLLKTYKNTLVLKL